MPQYGCPLQARFAHGNQAGRNRVALDLLPPLFQPVFGLKIFLMLRINVNNIKIFASDGNVSKRGKACHKTVKPFWLCIIE